MEYKERNQLPPHCKACGETSEAMCFICDHFHEKYALADEKLVIDRARRRLMRKLLQVESDLDYYVLRWKPVTQRPADYSYVIIEELDDELGMISCAASYENNRFWYFNNGIGATPVEEEQIMGWDYFPYDSHENEKKANEALKGFFGNLGQSIRREIEDILEGTDESQK